MKTPTAICPASVRKYADTLGVFPEELEHPGLWIFEVVFPDWSEIAEFSGLFAEASADALDFAANEGAEAVRVLA